MKKITITLLLIFTLAALAACAPEVPPEPGTIIGSVYLDCNQNEECDCDDIGFADVDIKIYRDKCAGVPLQTIFTDDEGNFVFTDLEPGTYCVMTDIWPSCDDPAPISSISQTVTLGAGQQIELEEFLYRELGQ